MLLIDDYVKKINLVDLLNCEVFRNHFDIKLSHVQMFIQNLMNILNVKRRSDLTRLYTRSMFSSVFEVEGPPERYSSSMSSLPPKMICASTIKNNLHRTFLTFQTSRLPILQAYHKI